MPSSVPAAACVQGGAGDGIPVDESIARADAATAFSYADRIVPSSTPMSSRAVDDAQRMVAADAAGVKPNLTTAVYVKLLISRQNADGTRDSYHQRPPSWDSRVTFAALGLRAVDLFHHPSQKAAAAASVARARHYLETQAPTSTEERAYQSIGLGWAGAPATARCSWRAPSRHSNSGTAAGVRSAGERVTSIQPRKVSLPCAARVRWPWAIRRGGAVSPIS